MHDATVHSAECFLIDIAPRHNRAARHVTAAQRLCKRDDVRLKIPMLEAKHFAGAAQSGLHFIGNQQRPIFTESSCARTKKSVLGDLQPFPWTVSITKAATSRGDNCRSNSSISSTG